MRPINLVALQKNTKYLLYKNGNGILTARAKAFQAWTIDVSLMWRAGYARCRQNKPC